MLGWFRRFCLPPPPLVCWFLPVGLRFSFLLPFQGLPVPGQVCWCWCFLLPLFFCVPLLVFWLSNFSSHFHFHFTSISFSPSFSSHVRALVFYPTAVGCVCVKHLNRCKTSIRSAGGSSTIASLLPTKTLAIGGDTRPDQSGVPANFRSVFSSWQGAKPRTPTTFFHLHCCRNLEPLLVL